MELRKLQKKQAQMSTKKQTIEPIKFEGTLTSAFANQMHHYVKLERQNMIDIVTKMEGETMWWIPAMDKCPDAHRFASADEVLMFIKKSIPRSSKLRHEKTMFEVYLEYKS